MEMVGHGMLAEFVFRLTGPEAAERLSAKPAKEPDSGAPFMQWNHEANIQAAVKAFVATYRKSGMAGAAGGGGLLPGRRPAEGRDPQIKQLEYCAGMDLAAYRLDGDLSKLRGVPTDSVFHLDRVSERVARPGCLLPESRSSCRNRGKVGHDGNRCSEHEQRSLMDFS
ncbi:MAG: hypothetical protein M5R42_11685 [Rhodocyclaceae bacterium]|nr:hypothetical protein [Rhodocyclaceae bacterium]